MGTGMRSRRQRVMSRSRKLGHCICDPRQACPCDTFLKYDVCHCAGEPLPAHLSPGPPQLTRLVKNAGCASKIPPAELGRVLSQLPLVTDPRLLVGPATADDAGVFRLSDEVCLVQTVDVFSPCVDDPHTFGRIAAANALSDIYAMGGEPLTALSIVGYPTSTLPEEWMAEMLRGGMETLAHAGVVLVGGHSINDDEIKLGFAVTGLVNPSTLVTNRGARPGDALILTKPLGTGIIAFAAQMERASPEALQAAVSSMTTLNREAARIMVASGAHACTDVTGFGLLAHLAHIVRESNCGAEVWPDRVPLLPQTAELAQQGMISGAAERNRDFCAGLVEVAAGVPEFMADILYDPQTSGGLLLAVPAEVAEETVNRLRQAGYAQATVIGQMTAKGERRIEVTMSGQNTSEAHQTASQLGERQSEPAAPCCASLGTPQEPEAPTASPGEMPCCPETPEGEGGAAGPAQAFQQFMATAFAPGALDVVQKTLTAVALSVAVQCEPCLRAQLQKARTMGLTAEEIEEAAWMGIAFGGCKAMMFWNGLRRLLGTNQMTGESK